MLGAFVTRVRAFGGLANRLRVVLSWRATFGELEVVWRPDGEIAHGRFLDVFEPLNGVTFVDEKTCGTRTLDPYPHAPADWQRGYRVHARQENQYADTEGQPNQFLHVSCLGKSGLDA